jgi:Dolichyl-phosphate-mannose-protein mannosyltransferase
LAASETTRARVREESVAIVRSLPAWAWLASLVVASAIVRWGFGRRMVAPWIMVDELIYSELAKSFAAGGHFLVRGHATGSYGIVYPVLISPAFRLFASVPQAYAAAKAINAVLMSLTAVPAYFLARRVVAPSLALLAALLAVAVPSTLYAGTMMTENAFYPLFVCAALALVLCLERPTLARQLVLLAVCALAYATRAQAVALLPALVTAPLLLTWWRRESWRSLLAFRWLYGILGGAVVLVLAVELARGHSPVAALGAYETAGHQHYAVGSVLKWLLYHVAELDLYLCLLPFATLLVLALVARRLDGAAQAFIAAAVALSVWLVLEVAAFASLPTVHRVEERNMFYLAPLFFTALLLWIDRGLPRPRRATLAIVAVAVALPALLPYPSLIGVQVQSDTLALLPWWWLQDHVITLGEIRWVVLGCALVLGLVFLRLPRRLALLLPAVVLAYYAVTLPPIENGRHGVREASLGALFQGITTGKRDWVDATVGRDARVAYVRSGRLDAQTLWQNEFFNRSVGPVYELASPLGGGLPATEVHVDRRDGAILTAADRPVHASYVLTDGSVSLPGRTLAWDKPKGLFLVHTSAPLRETQLVDGLYPDTWSGRQVSYTRFRCRGGRVSALVETDAHLLRRAQFVSSGGVRVRVPPGRQRTITAPLRPGAGARCTARFTVTPTKVPGKGDRRRLGVHFLSFRFVA